MKYLVKVDTGAGKVETYTTEADHSAAAMSEAYDKFGVCAVTVSPDEGDAPLAAMTVADAMRIVKANWGDMRTIERAFVANSAPASGLSTSSSGERFFVDHGVWHDRVTGQHMWTQDQYDEESRGQYVAGVEDQMHGIAQSWALSKCRAPACPVDTAIANLDAR